MPARGAVGGGACQVRIDVPWIFTPGQNHPELPTGKPALRGNRRRQCHGYPTGCRALQYGRLAGGGVIGRHRRNTKNPLRQTGKRGDPLRVSSGGSCADGDRGVGQRRRSAAQRIKHSDLCGSAVACALSTGLLQAHRHQMQDRWIKTEEYVVIGFHRCRAARLEGIGHRHQQAHVFHKDVLLVDTRTTNIGKIDDLRLHTHRPQRQNGGHCRPHPCSQKPFTS